MRRATGFLRVIDDFHSFADAITNKLVSAISAVEQPNRDAMLD
jgi:hypothetical protein